MSNRPVTQSLQAIGMTLHGLRRQMERENNQQNGTKHENSTSLQQDAGEPNLEVVAPTVT